MIDRATLLADCKKQVRVLEDDLRERAAEAGFAEKLSAEWHEANARERIAAKYETWLEGQVTQAAVAWVLATVFLRFCEDNGLIDHPYLSGPGERATIAAERQEAYFATVEHRHETDREWILAGVEALSGAARGTRIVAKLFDPAHNPMWRITPSDKAAKDLIAFWRRRSDAGEIVHDFTGRDLRTRFLGDLYQGLSEQARKQYALLQTPEFVERFILEYTLDPAIKEFGLTPVNDEGQPPGLRLIDPACGSGHFLLGAFDRLADEWADRAPALSPEQQVARALASVHGVDKNPFAVSIARFRLLLAAMRRLGIRRLADAGDFVINVAVGDSLLHGRDAPGIQETLYSEPHHFATEDVTEFQRSCDILGVGSYHVVVGNPPYITPKDPQENKNYRVYQSCAGQYALSVPFAERMFKLARIPDADGRGSGFVGQITANSFMKREFGRKLIEEYLSQKVNLTHVIDTSGAYIPGHGTPTVILIGRRTLPSERQTVRAVLGVRGEPAQPAEPEKGHVWQAIVNHVGHPGAESDWVSVVDLDRATLSKYPWSLSGGGAQELYQSIRGTHKLGSQAENIGFCLVTREDDAYLIGCGTLRRRSVPAQHVVLTTEGQMVRDWGFQGGVSALFPYEPDEATPRLPRQGYSLLWPLKRPLAVRKALSGTLEEQGREWFEYSSFSPRRFLAASLIAFPFVATHPHFSLRRDRRTFIRTAPVIKLPEGASEDEHLALLGVLNSSTACFWLKEVSQKKGGANNSGGGQANQPWSWSYEFTGTKLQEFPLPPDLPTERARELDRLAQELGAVEPGDVCNEVTPTRERLDAARVEYGRIRGRMIALQEELDWDVYRRYGLFSATDAAELVADPADVPSLKLGERAFEIVLARSGAETQWFARHGSTPITEIPEHWPEAYKRVVEARIQVIEERTRDIGLIERPECKRRWSTEPWEKKEAAALRSWLLDRCENKNLWFDDAGQPRALTVNRLADLLRTNADVVSVARLYAGKDADLVKVLDQIIADEHVPYLAAYRYKASGLRKRAQWEDTWEKQREEDRTGTRLNIPVPDKYASADFTKNSYWRNRGKLDVPKERFISYLGASPDADRSLMLGWAGFDHAQQAHVLVDLIDARATGDPDNDRGRLTPLIAGLREVMPWVRQWHGEKDELGTAPADDYDAVLEEQKSVHGLSDTDLETWRPPKTGRGRR